MRYILLLLIPLIFTACDNQSIERTKELNRNNKLLNTRSIKVKQNSTTQKAKLAKIEDDTKVKLAQMNLKEQEKLAQIKAEKEQKIKELELAKAKEVEAQKTKQKIIEANNSLELAKINSQTVVAVKAKEVNLYKVFAIILLFIVFIWLIIRYLHGVSKRKHEALIKEQELNYEAYVTESKLKHENISKMLEIISDEKSDPAIKKEISKILTHNKNNLIEYKKK